MDKLIRRVFLVIIISSILYVYYMYTQIFLLRILSLIGLFIFYMLVLFIFLKRKKKPIKTSFNWLLTIYIFVTLILLIFSFEFSIDKITTLFFNPFAFVGFFLAILIYFIGEDSIAYLIKISRYMTYIIPLVTIFDLGILNSPVLMVSAYSFYFFDFIFTTNKKQKYFDLTILFCCIPLFTIFDYRSGFIIISLFLVGLLISTLFKIIRLKFIRLMALVLSFSSLYLLFFNFTEIFDYISNVIHSDSLNTINTRSFLFVELFSDFKESDYYLGRGYLGTYYSPYFKDWQGDSGDHFNRFSVEVGFLHTLLKGGFLLVLAMILLFVKSIYYGFVNQKPGTIKFIFSIWLLIEFSMMTIENIPSLSIHFMFIWIIIGIINHTFLIKEKIQISPPYKL